LLLTLGNHFGAKGAYHVDQMGRQLGKMIHIFHETIIRTRDPSDPRRAASSKRR
jgi:hypothetical protein